MITFILSTIILFLVVYYLAKKNNDQNAIHNSISVLLTLLSLGIALTLAVYTIYDVQNYPIQGFETIPTITYSYIDTRYGNSIIYEEDYTIKYSKAIPPESYNISISLLHKVQGFITDKEDYDESGKKIVKWYDAPNNTVEIKNINEINPFLFHVTYVSEENYIPNLLVADEPLPHIQNNSIVFDSFFVNIENTGMHDIKKLKLNSNVTNWIDIDLIQLKNESWTNQPVMIYDEGLPVLQTMINDTGIIAWEITSLNSGEQKIYHFKKIDCLSKKI